MRIITNQRRVISEVDLRYAFSLFYEIFRVTLIFFLFLNQFKSCLISRAVDSRKLLLLLLNQDIYIWKVFPFDFLYPDIRYLMRVQKCKH